jgi:hypothetical protein
MYYVIYEEWTESGINGSYWEKQWEIFDRLSDAKAFMEELESNDFRGAELLKLWRLN